MFYERWSRGCIGNCAVEKRKRKGTVVLLGMAQQGGCDLYDGPALMASKKAHSEGYEGGTRKVSLTN